MVFNSPLQISKFTTEIVEFALWMFHVFGTHYLKKSTEGNIDFQTAVDLLSESVIKTSLTIDDSLFIKMVDLWSKLWNFFETSRENSTS